MASEKTPKRLGRGLDALFKASADSTEEPSGVLREIPLRQIRNNPYQPRKNFNPEELKELRESLNTSGLLQPITVRRRKNPDEGFDLIAGERRLRAATELGWITISAIVKDSDNQHLLSLALIENLQRSDLNPIEEVEGYQQLITEFGHTQQTVATLVGKDRSTIANLLRILQLPQAVRQMVRDAILTVGQVRPLLALGAAEKIVALAKEAVAKELSAREIERRVREATPNNTKPRRGRPSKVDVKDPEIRNLEEQLRRFLQTDVSILAHGTGKGTIKIAFYSVDDLERILEVTGLTKKPQ
jgi:ParB family chromosome partitioning protein